MQNVEGRANKVCYWRSVKTGVFDSRQSLTEKNLTMSFVPSLNTTFSSTQRYCIINHSTQSIWDTSLSENKALFELARIVTDLLVSASCDGTLYALNSPPPPPPSCLWSSFLVWYSTKTDIKDKNTMKRKEKRDSTLPLSSSTPVGRRQLLINNEMIDFAITASLKETWKLSGLVIYYDLRKQSI